MQKITPSTINVTNDDAEYAEQILDNEQPLTETEGQTLPESDLLTLSREDMDKLEDLYKDLYQSHLSADDASEYRVLSSMQRPFNEYTDTLRSKSCIAKLWLQYMNFINILKLFIRAERTGDLNLHLVAVMKMLNVFAATGHFNFVKSARLYLKMMSELLSSHPWLYNNLFSNGYHTVRRSDRYWAGLWTDLTIEQVMIRTIKGRGGLTRGRERSESV